MAYLTALRGVRKRLPALDPEQVKTVGFPEPWPGDPGGDDSERAAHVIKDLRRAIQEIGMRDSLYGAVLDQYFFGEGTQDERQKRAARAAAGRKASAPRNAQRTALRELARQLYLQVEKSDTSSSQRRGAVPTSRKKAKPTADNVTREILSDLEGLYEPDVEGLDRLARMIVSDAPVCDATVRLTLSNGPDDSSYRLVLFTEDVCRRSAYYLAVTARATLTDLVKSTCDQVDGFFTCSDRSRVTECVGAWMSNEKTLKLLSSTELGEEVPLPLRRANRAERKEVLAKLRPTRLHQDVVLLRATIPPVAVGLRSRVALQLSSLMARSDHCCSWFAGRPTFLKEITFDASGMKLDEGERFTLQPCFRGPRDEPELVDNVCHIFVGGWIVRGQGAVLVWA